MLHYQLERLPLNFLPSRRIAPSTSGSRTRRHCLPSARGHPLDPRLPPDAGARDGAQAASRCANRVLPAHAVSGRRRLPGPPWRRELLDGILGSTLVGFQTAGDTANFGATLRGLMGYAVGASGVIADGRRVDFGTYPVGIDAERLREAAGRPAGSRGPIAGCSSASIGSTTRRAFRCGWRLRAPAHPAHQALRGACSSCRWPCRRASTSRPTRA